MTVTTATTPAPPVAARRRSGALAGLAAAQFMVVLDGSIVNVALPTVRHALHLSAGQTSLVVDGYLIAFAGLLLFGGRLTDVFARRPVFLLGLATFVAASAGCAAAPDGTVLVTARVVQGVGAAVMAPAALSIVLVLFAEGRGRARALGVWGGVSGAGGVGGVLLGGLLAETWGWPSIFLINVPVGVLTAVVVVRAVPPMPALRGSLDVAGALSVSVALAALAYALVRGSHAGWVDPVAVACLLLGAGSIGVFVAVERRARQPLVPLPTFRRVPVVIANGAMLIVGGVSVSMFFFLPQYQQEVLGMSATATSVSQLPLAVAITTGSLLAPTLTRRFGPVRALSAALIAMLLGLVWLAPAPDTGGYLVVLLGPFVLVGLGLGGAFVALTTIAVSDAAPGESGLVSGLVNTARQMGGALGLAVVVAVAHGVSGSSGGTSFTAAFTAAAVGVVITLALVRLLRPRGDRR